MGDGLNNPPTYETVYITPLNFPKSVKLHPKVVLKNHKIKNPIVLDSK